MSSTAFTSERDTPTKFDISYDYNIPQRELSDFNVTRNGDRILICILGEQQHTSGRGKYSYPFVARGIVSVNDQTLKV